MVLRTQESSIPEGFGAQKKFFKMAFTLDRLSAFFVDMFLISTGVGLLIAPLRKQLHIAQMLDDSNLYVFYLVIAVLVGLTFFIGYHTLFVYFQKATPGKKMFHLHVVDYYSQERLTFLKSFQRAVTMMLDVILLFPLAAIYSHEERRTIHDRISDSVVITTSHRASRQPNLHEKRLATLLRGLLGGLAFVFITVVLRDLYSSRSSDVFMNSRGEGRLKCESVTQAQEGWPVEKGEVAPRLKIALALYGAGEVRETCLEKEADFAFEEKKDLPLAYLANSFAQMENVDLSNEYLDQVCAEESTSDTVSEACEFSKLVKLWSEKKWSEASLAFQALLPGSSQYVRVWAIKHFERSKEFSQEMKFIEELWPQPYLAKYLDMRRTMALWGMNHVNEALSLASSAFSQLDSEEKLDYAAALCFHSLKLSCQTGVAICHQLDQMVNEDPHLLSSSIVSVAFLESRSCNEELSSKEVDKLFKTGATKEILNYYYTLRALESKNIKLAREGLEYFAFEKGGESVLSYEARRKLISLSEGQEDLAQLEEDWKKLDEHTWNFRYLGDSLMKRYLEKHLYEKAYEISKGLVELDSYRPSYKQGLMAAAYYTKNFEEAEKVYQELKHASLELQDSSRSIASEGDSAKSDAGSESAFTKLIIETQNKIGSGQRGN